MKVLITGGLGFIGSHVTKSFSKSNDITIIDLPDKVDTISEKDFNGLELIGCDISDWDDLKQLCSRNFDLIIHCAAQNGGYGGLETPQKDCDWNAKGTLNICELALKTGNPKIVYTSSVAVYGEGDCLSENDEVNPISNYGVSKLAGELYLKAYRARGLDTVILRLFNTYGPGQNYEDERKGVVSIFLKQLLHSDVAEMTGSPDRYRDCIHVHDVVKAIQVVSEKSIKNIGTVNVCNGEVVTMKKIVETLAKIMGKEVEIKNIGGYPGDPFGYYGNNEKLESLGWVSKFTLEKGFRNFYESVSLPEGK